MTIYISSAAGSSNLVEPIRSQGIDVVSGRLDSGDVEFLGWTGAGPMPIGMEHKNAVTSDIFTSMQDGRLNGEQMPKLVRAYPWVRYLIIEGNLRRSSADGVLEIKRWHGGKWEQAFARNGKGWTYDEFENRIESICEFFSYPHCIGRTFVKRTYDQNESVAYIIGRMNYWSKPYEDHSSHRQQHTRRDLPPVDPMIPSSETNLTQLWAAGIDGIGDKKSVFVARHFRTPLRLANATAAEWREIKLTEGKQAKLERHFSLEKIGEFRKQIGHEE